MGGSGACPFGGLLVAIGAIVVRAAALWKAPEYALKYGHAHFGSDRQLSQAGASMLPTPPTLMAFSDHHQSPIHGSVSIVSTEIAGLPSRDNYPENAKEEHESRHEVSVAKPHHRALAERR